MKEAEAKSLGEAQRSQEEALAQDRYFTATQRQLIWRDFKKHKLAVFSAIVLVLLCMGGAFCEFISPSEPFERNSKYIFAPPQRQRFMDENGFSLRPFVYGYEQQLDMETLKRSYVIKKQWK